jgi:hypothetical protein
MEDVRNTKFTRIFNLDSDKNGESLDLGERWQGRTKVRCVKKDAEWVAPYDADVTAWLGNLNWLATTTGAETKKVNDTHALKAGVDRNGNDATTPAQRPLHSDSCWPNSQVAARTLWGDAHLVMLTALQDETPLPYYPFDKGGEEEIVMLNAGDTFVFRGDLIHFGAEYKSLNLRIHSYIDSPCAPEARDADKTYHLLPSSWPIYSERSNGAIQNL